MALEIYQADISRLWFVYFFRGVVSIAVALIAFFLPEVTLQAVGILIGIFAFLVGLLDVVRAFRVRYSFDRWWIFLVQGGIALLFALVAFIMPTLPLTLLLVLLGIWFFLWGILMLWFGLLMRQLGGDWGLPVLLAAGSFLLVLAFILWPQLSLTVFLYLFASFAFLNGLLDLTTAFRLRKHPRQWLILVNTLD